MLIAILVAAAPADAQVWKPHKRARVHAMTSTKSKTRKPETKKSKSEKSKVVTKKKKHAKAKPKKHHRSDDDFTIIEEDYPAN